MERIIIDKLLDYFISNKLICKEQHGFVPGKCCTTNLLDALAIIKLSLSEGRIIDVIYTDYSKVFDKVNQKNLIHKLEKVVLGDSDWALITSGVPQGSVLVLWSDIWDVPLNEKKCKVIRFGKTEEKPSYFIRKRDGSSQKLEISEGEKDLGVLISSHLKWSNHVNNAVNKANRMLGIVKRTFKHLDCNSFLLLYQSLIRPHLDYAVSAWNPSLKQDIQLIEKVQERATKLVNFLKHLKYEDD
ncbi:unnamed protein product [Brachionus calyciflorus]|uniref:Reverse transcriptase domain-containing protein n=1 Tax=Brachionus calyciflorus TaxID=104777 RepID=A0A813PC64_9BILA|nr:unnamed protein product [Brachionus calyciflorus]